jgi:hypothetical protein
MARDEPARCRQPGDIEQNQRERGPRFHWAAKCNGKAREGNKAEDKWRGSIMMSAVLLDDIPQYEETQRRR